MTKGHLAPKDHFTPYHITIINPMNKRELLASALAGDPDALATIANRDHRAINGKIAPNKHLRQGIPVEDNTPVTLADGRIVELKELKTMNASRPGIWGIFPGHGHLFGSIAFEGANQLDAAPSWDYWEQVKNPFGPDTFFHTSFDWANR